MSTPTSACWATSTSPRVCAERVGPPLRLRDRQGAALPEVRLAGRRLPLLEGGRGAGTGEALRCVLRLEKKGRGGKSVTVVAELPKNQAFLAGLAAELKTSLRHRRYRRRRSRRDPGRPARAAAAAARGEGLGRPGLKSREHASVARSGSRGCPLSAATAQRALFHGAGGNNDIRSASKPRRASSRPADNRHVSSMPWHAVDET